MEVKNIFYLYFMDTLDFVLRILDNTFFAGLILTMVALVVYRYQKAIDVEVANQKKAIDDLSSLLILTKTIKRHFWEYMLVRGSKYKKQPVGKNTLRVQYYSGQELLLGEDFEKRYFLIFENLKEDYHKSIMDCHVSVLRGNPDFQSLLDALEYQGGNIINAMNAILLLTKDGKSIPNNACEDYFDSSYDLALFLNKEVLHLLEKTSKKNS